MSKPFNFLRAYLFNNVRADLILPWLRQFRQGAGHDAFRNAFLSTQELDQTESVRLLPFQSDFRTRNDVRKQKKISSFGEGEVCRRLEVGFLKDRFDVLEVANQVQTFASSDTLNLRT